MTEGTDSSPEVEEPSTAGDAGGLLIPTNESTNPNQSGWLDEMDSSAWPSSLWTQTGDSVTPTRLTELTAWNFALTGTQRVELLSLLAPSRLDSQNGISRVLGRMAAAGSQEFRLGIVNDQADTIGTDPTSGVWIARDSGGACSLNWAEGGNSETVALAFDLPTSGYWDVALVVRTDGDLIEATAFVVGLPVGSLNGLAAPTGWLYPRVAVKGSGSLALDRLGRATLGHPTGENLL